MMLRSAAADGRARPAMNLAANPRMRRLRTGSVVVRRNHIATPEISKAANGWLFQSMSHAGVPGVGRRYTAMTGLPADSSLVFRQNTDVTVERGDVWSGAFSITVPSDAPRALSLSAVLYSQGANSFWKLGTPVTIQPGETKIVRTGPGLSVTAPAGATHARLTLRSTQAIVAGDAFIINDGSTMERTPDALAPFHGASTDRWGTVYAYEGTANASRSVIRSDAVEVRRNLFPDPRCTKASSFTSHNGVTHAVVTDSTLAPSAIRSTRTATGATRWVDFLLASKMPAAGATVSLLVWMKSNITQNVSITARSDTRTSADAVSIGGAALVADVPQLVLVTGTSFLPAATGAFSGISLTSSTGAVGDWLEIAMVDIETAAIPASEGYLDGSTTFDSDLMAVWAGAENNSESYIVGAVANRITGAPGAGRNVFWSWLYDGLRIRSTILASQTSGAILTTGGAAGQFLLEVGKTYTVLAKLFLPAPMSSGGAGGARRIYALQGTDGQSEQAPNVAGEHLVRVVITCTSTGNSIRLGQGNVPSDVVVWRDLMVVEGAYDGLYLDGDMPGAGWTGPASDSPSAGYRLAA